MNNSNRDRLRLESVIWTVAVCAQEAGVTPQLYRRRILPLKNHPAPLNTGTYLEFHRDEVKAFLADPAKMRGAA